MATAAAAAAYGCSAAWDPPLPAVLSARRAPPPHVSLLASSSKLGATARRLRVSCPRRRLSVSACSSGDGSSEPAAAGLPTEAVVDIKLPRRSLLVQFTCNACGERTKRLINRVAYERGTVFLQCAGCQVYHKFVDNLGLVVEYDLREKTAVQEENVNTDTDD
ncbi:hypothetical protein ACP4OV_027665 [Aristida adscensionis]